MNIFAATTLQNCSIIDYSFDDGMLEIKRYLSSDFSELIANLKEVEVETKGNYELKIAPHSRQYMQKLQSEFKAKESFYLGKYTSKDLIEMDSLFQQMKMENKVKMNLEKRVQLMVSSNDDMCQPIAQDSLIMGVYLLTKNLFKPSRTYISSLTNW